MNIRLWLTCWTLWFLPQLINAQVADNRLCVGTSNQIYSTLLKETRTVWVHLPAHSDPKQRYPVLYVLDGENHFGATVGMTQQMAGVWPEMIVVGITNTVRERDLTPARSTTDTHQPVVYSGQEDFLQFIGQELIPYIDSRFPTTSYRLLSGHSLGGLTVINALLYNTQLFNAYIALEPSLWWDNQQFLQAVEKKLATKTFTNTSLFMAVANPTLATGLDTVRALRDTTAKTMLYRSVTQFIKGLRRYPNNGLRWNSQFFPDERHGTIQLVGQYKALTTLFDYYPFRTSQFENHPELDMDSVLVAHYKTVSARLGYTVLPSEELVNNLGYTSMGLGQPQKAYAFFKRNVETYPKSANAYDSLGDYFVWQGEKIKAIAAFRHALSLQETADTRRKLDELLKK
ncbi:alpha/beta hydrolase-fold protein [Spirosoma linguale]|uniref:Esterase n=1 Tax=Spirosoma linguale (strain ATCC 33905 / DSM 74 / LMG 10896 / Claus 1) TaxID=504472 RepID=D2QDP2_SPILD|nr:putative esterase [Spirosoma linguale DSM 74]